MRLCDARAAVACRIAHFYAVVTCCAARRTTVGTGCARLRISSRRMPISRGPESSDDYLLAADRCSLVFRAASREVALLRARPPSYPADASLRDRTPASPPSLMRRRRDPQRQSTHITTPPTKSTGGGRGAAPSGGCTLAPDGGNPADTRRPSSVYNIWPGAP